VFDKKVNFRNLFVEDALIFKSVNLKNADFLGTDLRVCEFNACKWNEKSGRYIIINEIKLFQDKTKKPTTEEIQEIEELYRNFKIKAKEMYNEYDISHWNYSEKIMLRKRINIEAKNTVKKLFKGKERFIESLRTLFNCSVLNLYALLSGYGEDPARAFLMLLFMVLLYSLIYYFNLPPKITISYILQLPIFILKSFLQGVISIFKPIFLHQISYNKPLTLVRETLLIAFYILFYIQIAFVILALRNRFKRI
jgi:hypothetical protein